MHPHVHSSNPRSARGAGRPAIAAIAAVATALSLAACGGGASAELADEYRSTYDTAQSAMSGVDSLIAQAEALYAESEGKVADEQARVDLQAAIDQAKGREALPDDLQETDGADDDTLTEASAGLVALTDDATTHTTTLSAAIAAVRDSMSAKGLADGKAVYDSSMSALAAKIAETQASLANPGPHASEGVRTDASAKLASVATARDGIAARTFATGDDYRAAAAEIDALTADLQTNNAAIHASAGANLQQAANAASTPAPTYTGTESDPGDTGSEYEDYYYDVTEDDWDDPYSDAGDTVDEWDYYSDAGDTGDW